MFWVHVRLLLSTVWIFIRKLKNINMPLNNLSTHIYIYLIIYNGLSRSNTFRRVLSVARRQKESLVSRPTQTAPLYIFEQARTKKRCKIGDTHTQKQYKHNRLPSFYIYRAAKWAMPKNARARLFSIYITRSRRHHHQANFLCCATYKYAPV